MRDPALLVLSAVAMGCSTAPAPDALSPPAGCEDVAEAQGSVSALTAGCIVLVGIGVHIGCSKGLLDAYCPAGSAKTIQDTWDPRKHLTIDCDLLQTVVCGTAGITAVELMREACGGVP